MEKKMIQPPDESHPLPQDVARVYDQMYSSYGDSRDWLGIQAEPQEIFTADVVRKSIESTTAELELENQLRADARLFLLVNFHELILIPLLRTGRTDVDQSTARIQHDLIRILDTARSLAHSRSPAGSEVYVSGHTVVDALAASWNELELTSTGIWS
jgi:hypothetical protein